MSQPFVGQLALFPWGIVPRAWAPCQGQTMSIQQNSALFALLGTTYGGNGTTTFNLPDLRGRTPVSSGNSISLGAQGGEEAHTLTNLEVPSHTHLLQASNEIADADKPNGNLLAQTTGSATMYQANPDGSNMAAGTMAPYGSGQPHENRQPFVAMNWCIALSGIFPSKN
jgi:microcystin-dependent protein